MEEIQVGEYVRTEKQGIKRIDTIFQNKTVNKYGYEIDSEWDGILYSTIKTTDIVKHSFNLIDLIEESDYVNGKLVSNVDKVDNMNFIEWDNGDMYSTEIENDKFIKSIVTHEQFASLEYKVEEK